jgi:predicted permease
MFLWILMGYAVKNLCHISDEIVRKGNKIVFTILLPIAIFTNVTSADIDHVVQPGLMVFLAAAIITNFFFTWKYVKSHEKDATKHGSLIQGIFRSNFVLFGIPLVTNIYSHAAAAVTSFMVAIAVPIFNVLAIFTLETNRIDRPPGKVKVGTLLISVIKNPLIIGSVVGVIFLLARIPIPDMLHEPLRLVSRTSTQIALFIMGGAFKASGAVVDRKRIGLAVFGKLVFWPIIMLTAAILLGFRDVELATILALVAAPTAVNSYTMSEIMGNDGPLAASIVVFTTLFAAFTVFMFVFVLGSFGFIGQIR